MEASRAMENLLFKQSVPDYIKVFLYILELTHYRRAVFFILCLLLKLDLGLLV